MRRVVSEVLQQIELRWARGNYSRLPTLATDRHGLTPQQIVSLTLRHGQK